MISFNCTNPMKSIIPSNDIAIDTISEQITYAQLISKFENFSNFLKTHGITNQHRILIFQQTYNIADAYMALLACMWHGVSSAYARSGKGLDDILIQSKINVLNPTAIYFVETQSLTMLEHVSKKTKVFDTEALCNFTHGPSANRPFNCNPIHWNISHGNPFGHNLESITMSAYELTNCAINQITDMDPNIPYSTDILIRSIFTGGKLTILSTETPIGRPIITDEIIKQSRLNYVCGFKKTFLDLFYSISDTVDLLGCEFGGGPLDDTTFTNIFKKLNPKKLKYHFSSYVFGYIFIKTMDQDYDTQLLNSWNQTTDLYNKDKEIKFDDIGNLFIKIKFSNSNKFENTGDRFSINESIITYFERTADDFIFREETGGKIYIHEIENIIRSFSGVDDAKVFFTQEDQYISNGYDSFGMVFHGEISEKNLRENLKKKVKIKKLPRSIFKIEKEQFDKIKTRNDILNVILKK